MKPSLAVDNCACFLSWLLFFCLAEGAGSLPWTGGSAAKPGKPKGKKKLSSVRQKFDVGGSSVDLGNNWLRCWCDGTGFSFQVNPKILVGEQKKRRAQFGEERCNCVWSWQEVQRVWDPGVGSFRILVCYCIKINTFSLVPDNVLVTRKVCLHYFSS